jgi:hypothetical protein
MEGEAELLLVPKADMAARASDVRFRGRADIRSGSTNVC